MARLVSAEVTCRFPQISQNCGSIPHSTAARSSAESKLRVYQAGMRLLAGCYNTPTSNTVSPPQTIAHYRMIAKIGEGGMGEVYRALDTKLGREVAIKIIPETFARDADRMMRFGREAR